MSQAVTVKQNDNAPKTIFGFWVYLMTDCILFASLFATFVVLRHNTYGGPTGGELFSLPYTLAQTLILLTSSFTCGLAIWRAYQNQPAKAVNWLRLTFLLGVAFLALEINEFSHLYHEGNSWQRSGFLSAFFTLVGTHGLHVTAGLLWMAILIRRILKRGLTPVNFRRLFTLSLFWHFLDIIWIFIFTIVYLVGAVKL
jgi:cytochrome o ubiquinol oxidase subunit 3